LPFWSNTVTPLSLLFDPLDAGTGVKLDLAGFLRAFEQGGVNVNPVDHGIGVAKALAKRLTRWNLADLVFVQRVVHDHVIGEHRATARLVTHAQRIKGMKGIGTELNAGTNLANLRGLLQHLHLEALAHQGQGGGQAANATTCNQNGQDCLLFTHGLSPSLMSEFEVAEPVSTHIISVLSIDLSQIRENPWLRSILKFSAWTTPPQALWTSTCSPAT
jgi:hypothetical protein